MANKYGAKKVKADGYIFDSQMEFRRYCELKMLEKAKEISMLTVHPKLPIKINNVLVCNVELDFSYRMHAPKRPFKIKYEDTKGFDTAISRLKRKLLKAAYPDINLEVIYARAR